MNSSIFFEKIIKKKKNPPLWDFPGSPTVKTHAHTARGRRSIFGLGKEDPECHVVQPSTKQTKNRKNTTSLKAKINSEGYSMLSYKIPHTKKKTLKAETSPLRKL